MRDLHDMKGRSRLTQRREVRKGEMQNPAREQGPCACAGFSQLGLGDQDEVFADGWFQEIFERTDERD